MQDTEEGESRRPGRPRDEAARERIRSAAVELLEEVGFANVTCDAIAQRSGASKATIYRWWPDKTAVVIDAFVKTITPELPLRETDTLEEYVRVHLRQFAKGVSGRNGRLLAAIIAAAQNDPQVEAAFLSHWIKPRRAISRKALQRFKNEGLLPERFDIEQVLDAMYGPLHFLLMVRHGSLSAAYAESLAALLVHGLGPRSEDRTR
ncbi:MAG TPA: TetR/AcrR family transcriptional regulator [Verrucomicrobiae bacterium]|nr:TetR/AcrR family transcriptional regulator [Verrucomicrobiae bacterium]